MSFVYRSERGWQRIHAPDVNDALRAWEEGRYSAKESAPGRRRIAAVALAREHRTGKHDAKGGQPGGARG